MQDSLELIEWPALFERLLAECLTPYGVKQWQAEPFLPDAEAMARHQEEVENLKTLLLRYGDVITETAMPDVSAIVLRLAKGGFLTLTDLRQLIRVLTQGGRMLRHFARNLKSEPSLPMLTPLLDEAIIPQAVLDHLDRYIEADGELKDSASPKLNGLRAKLRHHQHALQQQVQRILQHPDYSSALQSTTVTERDGRMVFPVKVEYKSKLPGVIHGASSSGSTVFVEPQAIVQVNNELQGVQAELQQEIDRILKEISVYLHEQTEALEIFTDALGWVDRRLAAARLSRVLNAHPVTIASESQVIDLKQARHPMLVLQNKASQKTVVANDIRIGLEGIRTLVITGPNTGGKTVLLKTIGLFALMLRAGLHLPVAENSSMSLFQPVLADIGDSQSIAQSLSTFSAHIERLKNYLADETDLSRGLVLVDEIAAGTDPTEGAALAKAILDELYEKGAITVVTTHLGELKLDAHQHAGFMNASVEFDAETLSPTYRLMLGVPGASNAITIAQKLGLKENVIAKAKAALSAPQRESAELLQELEQRNRQLDEELQKAQAFRLAAQDSYEKVEFERQKLETEKRQALKQFQNSLKGRLHGLEDQLKLIRKEMQQGEIKNVDRLSRKIKGAGRKADAVFSDVRDAIAEAPRLKMSELKVGETLFSRQLEITGEVMQLLPDSGEVVLQSGIIRVTVPVEDLQRPYSHKKQNKPQARSLDRPRRASEGDSVLEEPQDPSLSCDVRGQRVDDAVAQLEKFLDEAVMSGYKAVAVIHGLGTGALKKSIREYLAGSAYVQRYYPAQATQGGDGKTIIELSG